MEREANRRDWEVIWSTQRQAEWCEVSVEKEMEVVAPNWDKLELLEGLLLPGWPLKEQLVQALIQWIDVAHTAGHLPDSTDQSDQKNQLCRKVCLYDNTMYYY